MKKAFSSKYGKMTLKVPFIMKKGKSGFVAECIDLNIVTQGSTIKGTRKNVAEAIRLHLKSANELGILDDELEKLGVVKRKNKLEVLPRELENIPVEIPMAS